MLVLSISDICKWSRSNPGHRNFREGEKIVAAKHIVSCGVVKNRSNVIEIAASCVQTSNLRGSPHEIKGVLNENGKVISMSCSCKAGLGEKCKHIMATLLYCSRNEITVLSCTERKCQWKRQFNNTLHNYVARPLEEHDCFKKIKNNNDVSTEVKNAIRLKILENLPQSAFSKHISGRHDAIQLNSTRNNIDDASSTKTIDETIEALFSNQNSDFMEKVRDIPVNILRKCCEETLKGLYDDFKKICQTSRDSYSDWQLHRRYRITGSRCYALFTYSKRVSADWNKKADEYFNPKSFKSIYTEYGEKTENEARTAYVTSTNDVVIEFGLVISSQNPWLAYSPDGVIFENNTPSKLLEIKCPFKGKTMTVIEAVEFEFKKGLLIDNGNIRLKENHSYYAQTQLGMAVLNLKKTVFVIYASFDKSMIILDVPFDEMYTFNMLSVLKKTYYEKMLHVTCPNDENSDSNNNNNDKI